MIVPTLLRGNTASAALAVRRELGTLERPDGVPTQEHGNDPILRLGPCSIHVAQVTTGFGEGLQCVGAEQGFQCGVYALGHGLA